MQAHERADYEDGYVRMLGESMPPIQNLAITVDTNPWQKMVAEFNEALGQAAEKLNTARLAELFTVTPGGFIVDRDPGDETAETADEPFAPCADCDCGAAEGFPPGTVFPFAPFTPQMALDLAARMDEYVARIEDDSPEGWLARAAGDIITMMAGYNFLSAALDLAVADYETLLDDVEDTFQELLNESDHNSAEEIAILQTRLDDALAQDAAQRRELDAQEAKIAYRDDLIRSLYARLSASREETVANRRTVGEVIARAEQAEALVADYDRHLVEMTKHLLTVQETIDTLIG